MINLYYSIYFLILCLIIIGLYYVFIPYLKKIKVGQYIREEGPRNHIQKAGTPTMGGIVILISYLITFLSFLFIFNHHNLFNEKYIEIILILIPTLGFCLIGFIDDLLIIIKKKNEGLSPLLKIILQLSLSILFYIIFILFYNDTSINFFGSNFDLKMFFGPFLVLIFLASTNSSNLTDGLDGLLTLVTIPIIIGFIIIGFIENNEIVVISSIAFLLSIISFLFFNFPKASLFMGDTGSFLIGGYISAVSIILKLEILLLIVCMVYIIEAISVILQVWYFKKTKGNRLFKMAPFHHHLEMLGWSEVKIAILYFFVSLFFTTVGVLMEVFLF